MRPPINNLSMNYIHHWCRILAGKSNHINVKTWTVLGAEFQDLSPQTLFCQIYRGVSNHDIYTRVYPLLCNLVAIILRRALLVTEFVAKYLSICHNNSTDGSLLGAKQQAIYLDLFLTRILSAGVQPCVERILTPCSPGWCRIPGAQMCSYGFSVLDGVLTENERLELLHQMKSAQKRVKLLGKASFSNVSGRNAVAEDTVSCEVVGGQNLCARLKMLVSDGADAVAVPEMRLPAKATNATVPLHQDRLDPPHGPLVDGNSAVVYVSLRAGLW